MKDSVEFHEKTKKSASFRQKKHDIDLTFNLPFVFRGLAAGVKTSSKRAKCSSKKTIFQMLNFYFQLALRWNVSFKCETVGKCGSIKMLLPVDLCT